MSKIVCGTLMAILVFMNNGCTYKKAETAFPNCDTIAVSYVATIQPILSANCYSCHTVANAALGGNYVLDNYDSAAVQGKKGFLYGNISDPDINSKSHMPRNAPSLVDCEIKKIKAWIDQGTKNN